MGGDTEMSGWIPGLDQEVAKTDKREQEKREQEKRADAAIAILGSLPTIDILRDFDWAKIKEDCDKSAPPTPIEDGLKYDAGKPPLFQGVLAYFPRALKAVAGVSAYGLAKYKLEYADKNWMRVENGYGRYSDALVRHTTESAFVKYDAESGLLHDAQAAWNALARLELLMLQLEDREIVTPKKGLEI